jgi:hypothetical protein
MTTRNLHATLPLKRWRLGVPNLSSAMVHPNITDSEVGKTQGNACAGQEHQAQWKPQAQ